MKRYDLQHVSADSPDHFSEAVIFGETIPRVGETMEYGGASYTVIEVLHTVSPTNISHCTVRVR